MTTNLLTLGVCTKSPQYHLPELDRQAILAGADNLFGIISSARLEVVERQRIKFRQIHGSDGTENHE
jgi:hypothetical protein